jgi:2-polyprenyl-3-methyl-5-hydroxy-6-metoxy-1,4-benzoquinol methylase
VTTIELDQTKVEAFGSHIVGTLNKAMVGLAVSVGHRTGLFDMLGNSDWGTSAQIAAKGGFDERYVREWLAVMTTGGIVEYRAQDGTYRLPPEHAAFTTTAAGSNNFASFATFISLMADVESDIVGCFTDGGGVPYERYTRFQELMAQNSGQVFDHALVPGILPVVPGLVEQLERGISVADVGCGSGHAVNVMARAFPNSRFTGFDFAPDGVAQGRNEAAEWGLLNASFEQADVATLTVQGKFDVITAFDAIHDQAQPRQVLANIARALKPGGLFLMADIAGSSNLEDNIEHPMAPWLYTVSLFHCMTVSLALDGEGLGTMWGEQKARELLAEAGFRQVEVRTLEGDPLNSYYIARK